MAAAARDCDADRFLASDKYDLERVLGRGGMGTVFEARHTRLGQRVAIKVLGDALRAHPELVTRFEREARAAGALSSPHAVRVFDIDQTEDGTPFIVMELLDGRDLGCIVEREGPQPVGRSVRWIIEACDAIGEAHRLGIIHRDIKPSNLLLCRDTGSVKVLDFGIAKRIAAKEASLTVGVAPLGTPQYMSPEQVRCAKDVDTRSDIWSLGVTLYELVCGRPPFNHEASHACIAAIVADPVPDPRAFRSDLPDELAAVLVRALAKDPDERFQSVDELVLALAPFADEAEQESGAFRIIHAARRTAANDSTTVPGEEQTLAVLRDRARREMTVPPTAARASAEPLPRRRLRRALALGGAGVLGLVALVATPRLVASRAGNAGSPAALQGDLEQAKSERAAARDNSAEPAASSTSGTFATPGASAAARAAQAPDAPTVKGAPLGAPARPFAGSDGPPAVHGGLSGPGF